MGVWYPKTERSQDISPGQSHFTFCVIAGRFIGAATLVLGSRNSLPGRLPPRGVVRVFLPSRPDRFLQWICLPACLKRPPSWPCQAASKNLSGLVCSSPAPFCFAKQPQKQPLLSPISAEQFHGNAPPEPIYPPYIVLQRVEPSSSAGRSFFVPRCWAQRSRPPPKTGFSHPG